MYPVHVDLVAAHDAFSALWLSMMRLFSIILDSGISTISVASWWISSVQMQSALFPSFWATTNCLDIECIHSILRVSPKEHEQRFPLDPMDTINRHILYLSLHPMYHWTVTTKVPITRTLPTTTTSSPSTSLNSNNLMQSIRSCRTHTVCHCVFILSFHVWEALGWWEALLYWWIAVLWFCEGNPCLFRLSFCKNKKFEKSAESAQNRPEMKWNKMMSIFGILK